MASGPILGFSPQPRTVQKEKSNIQKNRHQNLTKSKIDKAYEVKNLLANFNKH